MSATVLKLPETPKAPELHVFWEWLNGFDWDYDSTDDAKVWQRGFDTQRIFHGLAAHTSFDHLEMYQAFAEHYRKKHAQERGVAVEFIPPLPPRPPLGTEPVA